jgi:hypothetical protein
MYTKCGYTVYRRVLDYYTGENDEDAYGEFFFKLMKVALKIKVNLFHLQMKN